MRVAEIQRYKSYRQFLFDHLRAEGLSYRAFAARYGTYVSFPFLSKLLRRDANGGFKREVNMRPERLAALLKILGLSQSEISHLMLVRLEEDQKSGTYRHAAAFSQTLRTWQRGRPGNSAQQLNVYTALECLLPSRRQKVISELRFQLEIEYARTTSPLQAQKLKQLLEVL
jgi:hypothetical protein